MEFFKAEWGGNQVLIVCEQDACPDSSPLTWTDPVKDNRPLFILTNNRRYVLGDDDAEAMAWALLKASAKWDDNWLEEETLWWDDAEGNWSMIPWDRLRAIGSRRFDLRLADGSWKEIDMDDDPHFKWDDNPDFIDTGDGLAAIIIAAERCDAHVMPVYMYDHSGISLSLGRDYPFNDRWDAGTAGIILWTQEQQKAWEGDNKDSDARAVISSYFKEYNAYIEGDVYCLTIYDPAPGMVYLAAKRGLCADGPALTLDDLNRWDLEFLVSRSEHIESICGLYLDRDYDAVAAAKDNLNVTNMEELDYES